MAIDPDKHVIEPTTGFAIDKDTGHIVGLMQAPAARIVGDHEYPAWVVPHESQIVRKQVDGAPDHISTPGFAEFHVNRANGEITVLVQDAEDEERALSDAAAPKPGPVLEGEVFDADGYERTIDWNTPKSGGLVDAAAMKPAAPAPYSRSGLTPILDPDGKPATGGAPIPTEQEPATGAHAYDGDPMTDSKVIEGAKPAAPVSESDAQLEADERARGIPLTES